MTKKQKAQQVADILTGKIYFCRECEVYHEFGWTMYVNGVKMEHVCPKAFSINYDPIPLKITVDGIVVK